MVTSAGLMPARFIIHTVGPIWSDGSKDERKLLANAYRNCIKLATDLKLKSIAFPNISTGIYSFPKEEAADIALTEIVKFSKNNRGIEKIIFCCYDDENYDIYINKINQIINAFDK